MKRVAIVAVVLALIGGGIYWMYQRGQGRDIPTTPPVSAPTAGTCWKVDAAAAQQALPWAGQQPVACTDAHTVELFRVGQATKDQLHKFDAARGDDRKLAENLLYAQARRECLVQAPAFLGGAWREARVQVLAAWIQPATDGFFACGLAEVTGPAGDQFAAHTGSLKGVLAGGTALAIGCIKTEQSLIRYIGCGESHDGEYAGAYTITPPEAPFDETAVRSASAKGCTAVGLRYLGLSDSGTRADLSAASVGPKTGSDWLGSDQTFACYLMSAKPLKASVRGLGDRPLPVA